jgi:hypothetical protein
MSNRLLRCNCIPLILAGVLLLPALAGAAPRPASVPVKPVGPISLLVQLQGFLRALWGNSGSWIDPDGSHSGIPFSSQPLTSGSWIDPSGNHSVDPNGYPTAGTWIDPDGASAGSWIDPSSQQ